MASRTFRWMVAGSTVVLFGGGYFIYSLMAAQGQGTLAQAPLNIEVQTPPAFVMALDDSGSMVWETLNNTRDGVYHWIDGRGFYNGSTPYGYDQPKNATSLRYYYLTPPYGRGTPQFHHWMPSGSPARRTSTAHTSTHAMTILRGKPARATRLRWTT